MKKILLILLTLPILSFGQLPQLGDYFQGGIVFHVDTSQSTGLIVLDEEFYGNYKWGCIDYQMPGAFHDKIGKGMTNSLEIQENCLDTIQYNSGGSSEPSQNAANACLNFNHLGYGDWFLPSISELQLIYDMYGQSFVTGIGHNFQYSNGYYWSSTQTDNEDSWIVDFYDGDASGNYGKNNHIEIRPIRQFNIYGCKDELALNFDVLAEYEDNSVCNYSSESYQIISTEASTAISSLQQALDTWNTTIYLTEGWNMFGYSCPSSMDVSEAISNYNDKIIAVKANDGTLYLPEFSFNSIEELIPGFGYQIKLSEAIDDFNLCDWYVNDIPEDNIVSLQDSIELINSQIGCTDSVACNFDITHLYEDSSCEYPYEYYDCYGNELPQYQVGDFAQGGIVFYIDETGQHGLVAAMEDLESAYQWGCYGTEISGADGLVIGAGLQNTLDIVAGCSATNTAAYQSLNLTIENYSDWYLPSRDELVEILERIGQDSSIGNIGGFANIKYWSSSEIGSTTSWIVNFDSGTMSNQTKSDAFRARIIRSF